MTMLSPTDYDDFARRYAAGRACLVATTLVADLETPVSAYLKLAANRAGAMFLLESVEGGAQRGRYSMIGLDPDVVWRSTGGRFRRLPRQTTRRAQGAARRVAHRHAARPAADVGGRVRLSRLRHGAAHGTAAAG
jgi:anthranilate/para-aminobenzoate synthase component I